MKIDAYSGNYKMVDSGTIVMDDLDSTLKFSVNSQGNGFKFDLKVKFLVDSQRNDRFSKISIINSTTLLLECYNFNASSFTGMQKPQELATINGNKVYISMYVTTIDNGGPRVVSYTFYEMENRG